MFSFDEVIKHATLHRSWTVECQHRDDILKAVWAQASAKLSHALALYLKDADGLTTLYHLINARVVFIDLLPDDVPTGALLNKLDRIVDNG